MSIAWLEREPNGRLSIIRVRYGGIGKSDDRRRFPSSLTARAPHSGRTDDRHERRSDDRHTVSSWEAGVIHGLWKKLSNCTRTFHHYHSTAVGTIPNSTELEALAGSDSSQVEHATTSSSCETRVPRRRSFVPVQTNDPLISFDVLHLLQEMALQATVLLV